MESIDSLISDTFRYFGITTDNERDAMLVSYVEELERWNRRMNLTGVKDKRSIVLELVADGLFLHTVIPPRQPVVDLGSGSGVLAVPLAILDSVRTVFSLDKSLKKIQFQRHVKRVLGLSNLQVLHCRSEDLSPLGARTLVAKAFGSVPDILREGARHLMRGGYAFLVRGAGEEAPAEEGVVLKHVRRYRLADGGKTYQLFVYKKVT
jgi:16S rRNA (guanine527-N7)-methyltransferase